MRFNRVNLRVALMLGCFVGFFLVAFAARALAGEPSANSAPAYTTTIQGSTYTHRALRRRREPRASW
jgi:hypothetical protein